MARSSGARLPAPTSLRARHLAALVVALAFTPAAVAAPAHPSQEPRAEPVQAETVQADPVQAHPSQTVTQQPAPPTPALTEELQVTSVDLWVAVPRGGVGAWLRVADAGPALEPTDFELRVDGRPVKVAAIAAASAEAAPRRVVIFFDAATNDQASFRWAASRLAERAGELAALGEVEIVVADPDPRTVVAATRDATRLADALGGLSLFEGTEAAIPLLRDQFLAEEQLAGEPLRPEVAAAYVEDETALVLRQQDLLLQHLIEAQPATRAPRVLIYVSQGFDPRPEQFYLDGQAAEGPLATESEAWIRTLSAYGWTCLPLVYEDRRALLRRGFRIGKWRLFGPGGQRDGQSPFLVLFGAGHEAERDAKLAGAFLELGDGALERGELSEAVEAYLRAIHHFYGDPRTQERQAYAWRQLAIALRGSGEVDRARWAIANAIELDPSIESIASPASRARASSTTSPLSTASATSDALSDLAELTRDVSGLEKMATETGGRLLGDGGSLSAALAEIGTRHRLTFSLESPPSGRLLPLELALGSRGDLAHARWSRSGTPPRTVLSRLRLFLDELAVEPAEAIEGAELVLRRVAPGGSADTARPSIVLEGLDPTRFSRVMVGVVGEDVPVRVATLDRAPDVAGESGRWRGEIELNDWILAAAVYAENVASGEWVIEALAVEQD